MHMHPKQASMSVSDIQISNVAKTLVCSLLRRIETDESLPADLFTSYFHLSEKKCHRIVVDLIEVVGHSLPGVERVTGNKALHSLGRRRWQPDVVLWNNHRPILVIEYESLNSSDNRVLEKDLDWYSIWASLQAERVSLLIITTLPDFEFANYELRYTSPGQYNFEHRGEVTHIKRNPFQYWFEHFWEKMLDSDKELPVTFANFSGRQLRIVKEYGLEAP